MMHYMRIRAHGTPNPVFEFTCIVCGKTSQRDPRATTQRLCSDQCRKEYNYVTHVRPLVDKRLAENAAKREATIKKCPQCGEEFSPRTSMRQIYCSKKCNTAFNRLSKTEACELDDCDRPKAARGLCQMHWKRERRSEIGDPSSAWTERRKANYAQRRALKKNLPADNIRPRDVFERDEWICGLCNESVDRAVKYPDPKSPSLDHIIPLSLGGHHVLENVQLAHLACNVQKGNRVEADAMSA